MVPSSMGYLRNFRLSFVTIGPFFKWGKWLNIRRATDVPQLTKGVNNLYCMNFNKLKIYAVRFAVLLRRGGGMPKMTGKFQLQKFTIIFS
jgi:hypothetical protein